MLRWGVLGGRWGPVPSPMFLTLGGACGAAASLLVLETYCTSWRAVGEWEALGLAIAAAALLTVGAVRRRRERLGAGPTPPRGGGPFNR